MMTEILSGPAATATAKRRVLVRFSAVVSLAPLRSMVPYPSFREVSMPGAARDNAKSHPYFTQKIKLHSFHAQQAFDRGFELCANAIFSLSVVLRIIGTDEQAHEVEGLVDERLNKMFEDMRNEASRLDKMAEANGIEFKGIDYSHPKEVEAK
ncbi:MAG: hypothetical protein LC126_19750, partial [Bryobacterales bacterium]|nr:hypothetical protein [Bryobacterales bacterium]